MLNKKHLDISTFYHEYREEINYLFDSTISHLAKNDIHIYNRNNFYFDFVRYIYKYSYQYI